jgi:hypothetical protein
VSLQTTLARAEARHWGDQWRDHRLHCPPCSAAVAKRRWGDLCSAGAEVREQRRAADRELTANRRLDKNPLTGQEALP